MRRASFITVFVLSALTACASGGSGDGGDGGTSGGNRNLIVAEELAGVTGSAYEAVQRLRPRWLQTRGGGTDASGNLPATFVDGSPRGDFTALNSIPVTNIRSIRYLSARDATTLYGTGYPAGIIDVRTQ